MNNIDYKIAQIHTSVLLAETVEILESESGEIFVDCTLGLGGHTEKILQTNRNARVIGIDQDPQAIGFAKQRLKEFGERFIEVQANFSEIENVLRKLNIEKVDGILADLGVSSLQLDSETRGFSFRFDAPLDMRMNQNSNDETAFELLQRLSEFEIAKIIYEYGEEKFSRRIARKIVDKRNRGELPKTSKELAEMVARAVPHNKKHKIHPATRTFQALRIAVNRELEIIESFLKSAVENLKTNGRIVIISFHSLEDRIVKKCFQRLAGKCECPANFPICICGAKKQVEIITKKAVVPTDTEIAANPRSRSAKLRASRKL